MGRPEKIRLGDILVGQKLISQDNLKIALEQQKRSGRKLGRVLVELGFVTEEQICEAIARQLNIAFVNLKFFNTSHGASCAGCPRRRRGASAPSCSRTAAATFLVGMADPTDLFAFDELTRILKRDIETAVVTETSLLIQTIDRVYRRTEEITGLAKELEHDLGDATSTSARSAPALGAEDAPVVKLLQSVFEDAAQVDASDIHIEPQETAAADPLPHRRRAAAADRDRRARSRPALVLRLKLMAGLDISEKRLPQDGRFNVQRARPAGRRAHLDHADAVRRVGGDAAAQPEERAARARPPRHAGRACSARFRAIIRRTNGMVLVTGPTGSGKTTTLYAALAELNTVEREDHHRRGPGRVPAAGHQPGAGQREDRARPSRACCARRCARIRT